MRKHLLIIEDDIHIGRQVAQRLAQAGFETHFIDEGRFLRKEELCGVDLVILDLMLPKMYGLDVLKHLRSFSDVPVLVLSALNETNDKVRALQLGADDYLTKPFWPDELVERVRARLRRPVLARADQVHEFSNMTVDCGRREVRIGGSRVELTRSEFDVLAMLAERPGAAVTRRAIAERVLEHDGENGERTLDVHVSRLRKKLGGTDIVETVRGIGYRLKLREPD